MKKGLTLHNYSTLILLLLAMFSTPSTATSVAPLASLASDGSVPFLTTVTSNAEPYAGQELLLTYTLYFKGDAPKIVQERAPALQGLWAKERAPERLIKSTQKTIHGQSFRSAMVKQFTIVPLQSGTVTISGYTMQCTLPASNGVTSITAPAIAIKVRPLPAAAPEGFSGAVGTFTLELMPDKQALSVGEPITLQLKLSGIGSLQTLQLPSLLLPDDFRQNPAELRLQLNHASPLSSGTLTSTIVAWPQVAGSVQIPAISLIVFNPETAVFTTLRTKPFTITVNRVPAQSPTQEILQSREQQKNNNGMFSSVWWIILIGVLVLLIIVAFVLRRKQRPKHTANQRSAADVTQTSITSAEKAKAMKQQIFGAIAEKGIQKPEALTRNELLATLQQLNLPAEVIANIAAMLNQLNHLLYHPSAQQNAQTNEIIELEQKIQALLKVVRQAHHSK